MTWTSRVSRRRFLALAGWLAASALASGSSQHIGRSSRPLRIGAVLPMLSGPFPEGGFGEDVTGQIADMGTTLAYDLVPNNLGPLANQLKVLITAAPGPEAAARAAERLTGIEEVFGLIGGFTTQEGQALSQLAQRRGFVFMNVGAQADSLRSASCGRNTFHIAASARMYLDALARHFSEAGHRRWFVVYSDSPQQRANFDAALASLNRWGTPGSTVASAVVPPAEPLFLPTIDEIRQSQSDIVLLLLDPQTQLTFMGQYQSSKLTTTTIGYPSPAAQTRFFYNLLLMQAPDHGGTHISLWDATLTRFGAQSLNQGYLDHFGQAMDPIAWAAYVGVKLLTEAAVRTDEREASTIVKYLESQNATVDVFKGPGTSFRPWDHQLRQPLYVVHTNPSYQDKRSLQDLASISSQIPGPGPASSATMRLDQLGVGPDSSTCNFTGLGP